MAANIIVVQGIKNDFFLCVCGICQDRLPHVCICCQLFEEKELLYRVTMMQKLELMLNIVVIDARD